MPARAGMKKMIVALVIFDRTGIGRRREGAGHPHVLIIAVDGSVTSLAPLRVDVGGLRCRGGAPPVGAPCERGYCNRRRGDESRPPTPPDIIHSSSV
jgi:hypothetical protein